MIAKQYTIYNNSSVSRDSYGSRSISDNCKVMWARMVAEVHSSGSRLHLTHIMEVSMVHSGLAVVAISVLTIIT